MSAMLTGDSLLLDARPRAIWDTDSNTYRFYHRYRSFIPLEVLAADRQEDSSGLPRDVMDVEVWVPGPSPIVPFPDYSIVYLRGRMVLPDPGADPTDDSAFVLYVEVIFTHYRGCLQSPPLPTFNVWNSVLPEATIIGQVIDTAEGIDGWETLLIETVDELSSSVVRMNVAAILPPNIFRPNNLNEGSLVMAIGRLTAFAHPDLYLAIEVKFIRGICIEV